MTLGTKLQTLRKQAGLSQEALAEKLSVTRQTISKWELGQSEPDLKMVLRLSEIFQVSVESLIKESETVEVKTETPPTVLLSPKADSKVKKVHWKVLCTAKGRRNLLAVLTAAELVAACVCLICDYFPAQTLSWSLIVLAALAAAWLVLLPLLWAKEKILLKTLAVVSAVPFPLLGVLAVLLKNPLVFQLGGCIALVSVAALWGIFWIFQHQRKRLWKAFGLVFLLMIPVSVCMVWLVACWVPGTEVSSSLFNSGITLALSLGCFGMDALQNRRKEEAEP